MKTEINEIKKCLYKQKPTAYLVREEKDSLFYKTNIEYDNEIREIIFRIPLEETKRDDGVNLFEHEMDAKYLIRWLDS